MSSPVALLAISDSFLRQRIGFTLKSLRWQVFEMSGGAETLFHLEAAASRWPLAEQAIVLDRSLPDLDFSEFLADVRSSYPDVDLVSIDGSLRSTRDTCTSRRGEIMHAIRTGLELHTTGDSLLPGIGRRDEHSKEYVESRVDRFRLATSASSTGFEPSKVVAISRNQAGLGTLTSEVAGEANRSPLVDSCSLPELIGTHPVILEVSRRVHLVAARRTPVLILGPTGTGKELVARATHRLSARSDRPFVVLNCAAIPENLLETELFGHTRGAFTGAVQRRIGRIEAADGGTLFLDEIGEMSLLLQAKLLRFLESGEIQRVGENHTRIVDVRIIAATNQQLALRSRQGTFREDLFHRLAIFTIRTPPLLQHAEDVPLLATTFLQRLCEGSVDKYLGEDALELLKQHSWPGNVRELTHVIERALILSENRSRISAADIEFDSTAE